VAWGLTLVLNLMWVNPRAPTLMRLRRGWSWWSNARHRWGRSSRPGWGSFLTTCPSTRSPSPHPAGGPRGDQGVHHGLIGEGQDYLGDLQGHLHGPPTGLILMVLPACSRLLRSLRQTLMRPLRMERGLKHF